MMLRSIYLLITLMSLLLMVSCSQQTPAAKRDKHAENSKGPILIGAVWPHDTFWHNIGKGAQLAIEQINAEGGVLGRKLKLKTENDEASVNTAMVIAQNFAKEADLVAVIGHVYSYLSLATAPTYEFNGLLMISPSSTATKLMEQDHQRVFRMMPNNEQIGEYIANYIKEKGFKRVVIYYPRGEYGRDLANHFEWYAYKNDIIIVDRRSYLEQVVDHLEELKEWAQLYRFDALFLPATMPEAPLIIKQAREAGIHQPIIGGDAIDTDEVPKLAGEAGEGVIIVTPFHFKELRAELQQFITDYQKRFKQDPDVSAAYGYDAVKLIAHAITQTKSAAPSKMAAYLHSGKIWQGVAGKYRFDRKGDSIEKRLYKKIIKDGKLVPLDGFQKPIIPESVEKKEVD